MLNEDKQQRIHELMTKGKQSRLRGWDMNKIAKQMGQEYGNSTIAETVNYIIAYCKQVNCGSPSALDTVPTTYTGQIWHEKE